MPSGSTSAVRKGSTFTIAIPKTRLITRQKLRKYSWLPDVLRLKGSIVPRIFGPVLTCTIFATAAAYAWDKGVNIALPNSVVPLLSVVVGLILVFRNGTSYDRYYEGRKDFGTLISHVRNLSRLIWINVAVPPNDDASKGKFPAATLTPQQLRRKKVEALKLALAFAFACKHYLRGEDGLDWADYTGILPQSVIRLSQASSKKTSAWTSYSATAKSSRTESRDETDEDDSGQSGEIEVVSRVDATKRVRVKRSKDNIKASIKSPKTPLLSSGLHSTIDFHPEPDSLTTPLPLIVAHQLAKLVFLFKRDGYLETVGPAGTNSINTLIQGMVDMLTAMERVANTPIPRSYSIHLKQCVTLYLFSLPFTLVKDMGWGMIPVVTVVAFTLMGIEGIADEIEMPFGMDKFDLPLERYCEDLKEEIEYMVERLPEGGEGMSGFDDGEGDD
ncbi:Bestrophin, RFP-TM, chloride channel-domain-containing protein [Abortiporus biennis]|nr:Bestrophin, RFP-TM, chloride channel-domain-containing protein [Abortiporus biennis]